MNDGSSPNTLASAIVGDRFWLEYAQEAARGAISAPENRAAQLTAAIAWFWTVYSAAGIIAIAFGADRFSTLAAVAVGVPSLVLIIAYWHAARVSRPLLTTFDPRVPAEIEAAHHEAALKKKATLHQAEVWTAIAGLAVAIGLMSAAFVLRPVAADSLSARFDPDNPRQLLIFAHVARQQKVLILARAVSVKPTPVMSSVSALSSSSPDGDTHLALAVPSAGPHRVTVSWTDEKDKIEKSMTVEVKP